MIDHCAECLSIIDRQKLEAEMERHELPSIARRAAKTSKFCSTHCALKSLLGASRATA
jgi:hypothetical protein